MAAITERKVQDEVTMHHARRAAGGDAESLEWLIRRFQPVLLLAAKVRLGKNMSRPSDLENVAADVWAQAALEPLPVSSGSEEEPGPGTTLIAHLSGLLFNRVRDVMKRRVTTRTARTLRPTTTRLPPPEPGALDRLDADLRARLMTWVRRESRTRASQVVARLSDAEREILVLRGIERHPYTHIAGMLDVDAGLLPSRYTRVLKGVREALPGSIFDELPEA